MTTTDAFQARQDVLANAGATRPHRDAIDVRIIKEISSRTGRVVINDPAEVGGYPNLAVIQRPAGYDTDGDGISDSWEVAHGLDPHNSADGAQTAGDGYTP